MKTHTRTDSFSRHHAVDGKRNMGQELERNVGSSEASLHLIFWFLNWEKYWQFIGSQERRNLWRFSRGGTALFTTLSHGLITCV